MANEIIYIIVLIVLLAFIIFIHTKIIETIFTLFYPNRELDDYNEETITDSIKWFFIVSVAIVMIYQIKNDLDDLNITFFLITFTINYFVGILVGMFLIRNNTDY